MGERIANVMDSKGDGSLRPEAAGDSGREGCAVGEDAARDDRATSDSSDSESSSGSVVG